MHENKYKIHKIYPELVGDTCKQIQNAQNTSRIGWGYMKIKTYFNQNWAWIHENKYKIQPELGGDI